VCDIGHGCLSVAYIEVFHVTTVMLTSIRCVYLCDIAARAWKFNVTGERTKHWRGAKGMQGGANSVLEHD